MNALAEHALPRDAASTSVSRRIVFATRGRAHGPITRLFSPGDLGALVKPFVFLDYGVMPHEADRWLGIHPHSGIATVSLGLRGNLRYEDTTGKTGILNAGGVEWMRAGAGVWHDAAIAPGEDYQFYQLWLVMPQALELAPAESQYMAPEDVPHVGPVTVVLGEYAGTRSPIRSPEGVTYLKVELDDGQTWRHAPSPGHTVGWIGVYEGTLLTPTPVHTGAVAIFNESEDAFEFTAQGKTSFVIGTAIKHPHDLVLGYYSVHTTPDALKQGEAEISRIGASLRAKGRLRQ